MTCVNRSQTRWIQDNIVRAVKTRAMEEVGMIQIFGSSIIGNLIDGVAAYQYG